MPIGHLSGRFQRALPPLPQSRLCLRGLEVIPRSKYQKGALVSRSFLLCPLIDSLCPHRKGNGISGGPKTAQGHTVIRGRARRAPSILEPSKLLSPGQVLQNPLNGRERENFRVACSVAGSGSCGVGLRGWRASWSSRAMGCHSQGGCPQSPVGNLLLLSLPCLGALAQGTLLSWGTGGGWG